MRTTITFLLALIMVPAPAPAGPAYINSRGDRVELHPAPKPVAADFVRAGLITTAGAAFVVPGMPRHILLDRGVIVKIRKGVSVSPAELLAPAGLTPVRDIGPSGAMILCEARDAAAALAGSWAAAKMPEVEWAVPDFTFPVELAYRPGDPYYVEQWYHYQPSGAHIHSEEAWDVTPGDPQVIVAVFDTGVDITHPDFAPERMLTGYNAIDGSDDVTPGPEAFEGHGTGCAGLVAAAGDNREGIVGVCPQCSLLPIRFRGNYMEIGGAAEAYYHALDRGAWVASNSWGVFQEIVVTMDLEPVRQAIRDFVAQGREGRGAVALFASMNEGRAIGRDELANMPEVLAVGGTDYTDRVVGYSNFGPSLSVVAPTGADSFSLPQIITTDIRGDGGFSRNGFFWGPSQQGGDFNTGWPEPDTTGNYTRYFSGTSAATPVAAGVVALAFSANPDLTGAQARTIVEQTTDKVGDVEYDFFRQHNIYYGYGRVNADRAVRAAQLGFDNPAAAKCAEDFNCASDICRKATAAAPYGQCWVDCSARPDGEVCFDANACTQNDACQDGACTGTPLNCNDHNPCTDDACNPAAGCTHADNQKSCEDGDACTKGDQCSQGQCLPGPDQCDQGCGCSGSPGGRHSGSPFWLAILGLILVLLRKRLAMARPCRPRR